MPIIQPKATQNRKCTNNDIWFIGRNEHVYRSHENICKMVKVLIPLSYRHMQLFLENLSNELKLEIITNNSQTYLTKQLNSFLNVCKCRNFCLLQNHLKAVHHRKPTQLHQIYHISCQCYCLHDEVYILLISKSKLYLTLQNTKSLACCPNLDFRPV